MSSTLIPQIVQSQTTRTGGGDVVLTTVPTQQIGFGNISFDPRSLSQEQQLCAASCDKPLPRTQDEIVECLKTCGALRIFERDTEGQRPSNFTGITGAPFVDPQPQVCSQMNKYLLIGGVSLATLMVLMMVNKRNPRLPF
jgi:hypothetical protein